MGLIQMWPATLELLVIAAVISSIVAYSAWSSRARQHRESADKMAAKGQANSASTINAAQRGAEQPDMAAASKAASSQRGTESEAFSGRSR